MRFKLDENMPTEAGELLAAAGHDVATVLSQRMGGQGRRVVSDNHPGFVADLTRRMDASMKELKKITREIGKIDTDPSVEQAR